jgi:hypothetical protein
MTTAKNNLVLILFLFLSVSQGQNKSPSKKEAATKIDTTLPVIKTKFSGKTFPVIFEAAFFDGTTSLEGSIYFDFLKKEIGQLSIESGKLIAADPISVRDVSALSQVFPTGNFPVQLAMARIKDDQRVAYARILFSNKQVKRWEFALKPGLSYRKITDSTIYCFAVDAGTAMFVDSASKNECDPMESWKTISKKLEQSNWTGFIDSCGTTNAAYFSTGYGDGCYATYIGFDKKGKVCRLLVDFGLVGWWRQKEK